MQAAQTLLQWLKIVGTASCNISVCIIYSWTQTIFVHPCQCTVEYSATFQVIVRINLLGNHQYYWVLKVIMAFHFLKLLKIFHFASPVARAMKRVRMAKTSPSIAQRVWWKLFVMQWLAARWELLKNNFRKHECSAAGENHIFSRKEVRRRQFSTLPSFYWRCCCLLTFKYFAQRAIQRL